MKDLAPRHIQHIDLERDIPDLLPPADGAHVLAIFFWRGLPLGCCELPAANLPMPAPAVVAQALRTIAPTLRAHLLPRRSLQPEATLDLDRLRTMTAPLDDIARRLIAPNEAPTTASLVICTRCRPDALNRCLSSIVKATRPFDEIVIVDNAPSTDAARQVVAAYPGVTYVPEAREGLSAARNTGIRASCGDIIVFTDDDVVIHPDWPARIVRAFDDPLVMSVTGLILPAELATEAQVAFERDYGFSDRGFLPITYDAAFFAATKRWGVPVWRIGAGANMAFRRAAFDRVGLFDERLGAGASGCSEDSEIWYRLLAAGWHCRYDPTAVVYHYHRRDWDGLRRQIHNYMRGHVAALLVQFSKHRHWGNLRRLALLLPLSYAHLLLRGCRHGFGARHRLLAAEITGCLSGLTALRRDPVAAPRAKERLGRFLWRNPFPWPWLDGFFYREKMRAIHRVAPDRPAATRILEVGGGRSGLAILLYPEAMIVNLDCNQGDAEAPDNRRGRVAFVCGDATALPFPDGWFDGLTMFDVLEHVPDHRRAVAEAMRVLRRGGFLLVSTPNEDWRFPYYRFLARLCPTEAEIMARWGHVRRGYRLRDLEELVGAAASRAARFISPTTVVSHDVTFSRLPSPWRHLLCALLLPLTLVGYAVNRPMSRGTETAAMWRKA